MSERHVIRFRSGVALGGAPLPKAFLADTVAGGCFFGAGGLSLVVENNIDEPIRAAI